MPSRKKTPATTQTAEKGDCVLKLTTIRQNAAIGRGVRPALIVADPPYNIGQPYEAYADNRTYDDYMAFMESWLTEAERTLADTGSMWVFCPDEYVSEVDLYCRKTLKMTKQRHVIWAFTFGQKATRNFTRSHCHLLWLTRHKTKYTFNAEAVAVPSARQLVYKDKRAAPGGKPPDATWMLLAHQLAPHMGADKDVWLQSRVCGTFKERRKHSPNQIPVPLMERIVAACSDPGDLVVDPFAGTGSSGVACKKLGRNWLGFDLSKVCVAESNRRIKAAAEGDRG